MSLRPRTFDLLAFAVSAVLVLAVLSPAAWSCPITRTLGGGTFTAPFTRDSAFLNERLHEVTDSVGPTPPCVRGGGARFQKKPCVTYVGPLRSVPGTHVGCIFAYHLTN